MVSRQGFSMRTSEADYYHVQTPEKAIAFYTDKVKGLDTNLQELEKIVQSKSSQLRVVEESKSCQLLTLCLGIFKHGD